MKRINPTKILEFLSEPTEDRRPVARMLRRDAYIVDLIGALQKAETELNRQLLCDMLGYRKAKSAIPLLIEQLRDGSPKVRGSAADALAEVGDRRAGEALARSLDIETDNGVKQTITAALGAVGYKPAVPQLMQALVSPDATTRGCAAWSLGALGAASALGALKAQLEVETDDYSRNQIAASISKLEGERGPEWPQNSDSA